MSQASPAVKLPVQPGCVPTLGLPFLVVAPIVGALGIHDGLAHRASWTLDVMAFVLFGVIGMWGVFARHGFAVDVAAGVVHSGTGLFRPSMRRRHVLGLPLKLEISPFKVVKRGEVQTAYMVMLAGPEGRVKLDDFRDQPSAQKRKEELAQLLGLSQSPSTQ